MASIGLRYPYYAKYNYDESTGEVTYSGGGLLGKAVDFSAKIESGDDNNLYADDGVAESDTSFGGGELTITTDDLTQDASADIIGVKISETTVGTEKVTELVYDEDMQAPYFGFGVIIPRRKNGVTSYRAVVFLRIMFSVPEESAKTKGNKIEWMTPSLTATILRSEAEKSPWKRETTVESLATAKAYIKQILNITDATTGGTA